jgi:hypothetical protein
MPEADPRPPLIEVKDLLAVHLVSRYVSRLMGVGVVALIPALFNRKRVLAVVHPSR